MTRRAMLFPSALCKVFIPASLLTGIAVLLVPGYVPGGVRLPFSLELDELSNCSQKAAVRPSILAAEPKALIIALMPFRHR